MYKKSKICETAPKRVWGLQSCGSYLPASLQCERSISLSRHRTIIRPILWPPTFHHRAAVYHLKISDPVHIFHFLGVKFWMQKICQCKKWQISGMATLHTRHDCCVHHLKISDLVHAPDFGTNIVPIVLHIWDFGTNIVAIVLFGILVPIFVQILYQ